MVGLIRKVIGNPNDRALKKLQPLVDAVNTHSERVAALSDDALRDMTEDFRARLGAGETLDDLLPEAFAVAREAIARYTGERAFDVQLLGAIALHQGIVAEMATGLGKPPVATPALYPNAPAGQGTGELAPADPGSVTATWVNAPSPTRSWAMAGDTAPTAIARTASPTARAFVRVIIGVQVGLPQRSRKRPKGKDLRFWLVTESPICSDSGHDDQPGKSGQM